MRGEHIEQQHGQKTFASLGFDQHRKSTRRHEFLRTMNRGHGVAGAGAAGGSVLWPEGLQSTDRLQLAGV
ncbi:MAG: hypothetical protein NZ602_03315 [Thermoguttaceae bacterium]|nr:hypothetical protein [Thermoguttaceae bacterium]